MDFIHIKAVFEDQFSGAKVTKIITRSKETFNKMVEGVGSTFSHFDKATQIRYDMKVISVEQAVQDDMDENFQPKTK